MMMRDEDGVCWCRGCHLRLNLANLVSIMSDFLQRDERGSADVVPLNELNAFFSCLDIFNDNVVQTTATRRNGHIVFGVDSTQITLEEEDSQG